MTTFHTELLTEDEQTEPITRWRLDYARELGYDHVQTVCIATNRPLVDLHRLESLIKQGCSRECAYDILR